MPSLVQILYASFLEILPDRSAVTVDFLLRHHRLPNLESPQTFNEKLARRKLSDRNPRMPLLADKILVKAHVAGVLGPEWVVPTLWSGPALPPREERRWPLPYVLKASHGCGWNLFVNSEREQNWESIERTTRNWLQNTHGKPLREWLYGDITPQLLVEPNLSPNPEVAPWDFKIWVFHGEAHYIQVDTGRRQVHRRSFFDREWRPQPFTVRYPLETRPIGPPASLSQMLKAAERLGEAFSFVRVDFYEVNKTPLFGEMTFYPGAARLGFRPSSYDLLFGQLWTD
jgi:hypothetical protein